MTAKYKPTMSCLPASLLNAAIVEDIKKDLWDGATTQKEIGEKFDISQSMISLIYRGNEWGEAKWPDGSTGEMPLSQWEKNKKSKKRRSRNSAPTQQQVPSQRAKEIAERVEALQEEETVQDFSFMNDVED